MTTLYMLNAVKGRFPSEQRNESSTFSTDECKTFYFHIKIDIKISPMSAYGNRHTMFLLITSFEMDINYFNSFLVAFVNVHQSQKYTPQTLQEALVFIVIIIDCFMLIIGIL